MELVEFGSKFINKPMVYDSYFRITGNDKDYDKITRKKMIGEIIDFYSDYKNIIDICTVRELNFLDYCLKNDVSYLEEKNYFFEIENLIKKLIIGYDNKVFDELVSVVEIALKNVDYKAKEKEEKDLAILVGYVKTMGNMLVEPFLEVASFLISKDREYVKKYINENKLFRFYVTFDSEYVESLDSELPILIYFDYYDMIDEINFQRMQQAIGATSKIDAQDYINIFYYDFNINDKVVGKFISLINKFKYPSFILKTLKDTTLLNLDREFLIEQIYTYIDDNKLADDIADMLEDAVDRIPSAALNGMTPLEYDEKIMELENFKEEQEKNYTPHKNACIGPKKAKEFYKLYFGLLEYTNKKYKINNNLKIYKTKGINPMDLNPITEKFWENKEKIINEFLMINPFKFNQEEIEKVKKFKDSIYKLFLIIGFDEEYTEFMDEDKIYMVKGVTSNVDEVIDYRSLPFPYHTALIMFEDKIIYDGVLAGMPISTGPEIAKQVNKEKEEKQKYYHL